MYLSIDGGASKTHILLLNNDFKLIKELNSGPLNFSSTQPEQAIKDLKKSLKQVKLKDIEKAIFGLSGMDTLEEKLEAQSLLTKHFKFQLKVINDAEMALSAGTENPNAIVIIAGTGSHCLGHNSQGDTAKTSGLGWILADEGAGFSIGWEILRSAVRSYDGRGTKTCLEKLVLDYYNIDHIYDLKNIVYEKGFKKDEIASLCKLLDTGLHNDDEVSHLILENNVGQLLISLRPVVERLGFKNYPFDLVLAGSLFSRGVINFNHFSNLVKKEYRQANTILLDQAPVWGGIHYLKL